MRRLFCIASILFISINTWSQQENKITESKLYESINVDSVKKHTDLVMNFEPDLYTIGINLKPGENYQNEKIKIENIRNAIAKRYLNCTFLEERSSLIDSISEVFTNLLINNIIPYWYGTLWDFNGYTSIPNNGKIACGYFVSTTLRDMGLNLYRYLLAQQGPENEAKTISVIHDDVLYTNAENIYEELNSLASGVYFIGLDFHVGFLYLKEANKFFIHSNYIDGKVMIEKIEKSEAFQSSNYFISQLTGNKVLLDSWLRGKEIRVVK